MPPLTLTREPPTRPGNMMLMVSKALTQAPLPPLLNTAPFAHGG